uniref:Peptidase S1 domain-containing protein n=1 Tax=Anopheles culicifacies TaxID=139723 RepID=A0A182MTU7_9DIPT
MRYQLGWFVLLSSALCVTGQTAGVDRLVCGRRKVRSVYLIHNGIDARAGHWPWHATIFTRNNGAEDYSCGGTIIDEDTILTSAHCVFLGNKLRPANQLAVHVGRLQLTEPNQYTQVQGVREIIAHPGFKSRRFVHDIALIKLDTNITMTKYVQPACLWTMDNNQELIVGKNGTVLGFGLTEQDAVAEQLKQALVGVVDTLTCIANDRAAFGTQLTQEMFCVAGEPGVSACNGDSGGGLFLEIGGKWFVRGIVSFIPSHRKTGLCDTSKYTAFTDVAMYMEWIEPYINRKVLVFDTDDYDVDYEEKLPLFNLDTCGISSTTFMVDESRLTLPWFGNVFVYPAGYTKCIVTLVSEWYAIGPASCLENAGNELRIRLGDHIDSQESVCFDRNETRVCSTPPQTLQIHRIIIHPRYNRNQFTDNIALIELLTPADTTRPNAKPICVPIVKELYTNRTTSLSIVSYSQMNRSFESKPISYLNASYCATVYAEKGLKLNLEDKRLCGVLSAEDTMDCVPLKSGVALQELVPYGTSKRYVLRGLDGFGLSCEDDLPPTVYINLYAYLDWMLYNMRPNVVDDSAADFTIESKWKRLQQKEGNEKLRLFDLETCGESLTVQGTARSITYMPWIGSLQGQEDVFNSPERLQSKIVLISEWYALAPAHIFNKTVSWRTITLGYYDVIVKLRCEFMNCDPPYQEVGIKQVTIHPDYDGTLNQNNIALIELLDPANLTKPSISPICLPLMEELRNVTPLQTGLATSLMNTRRVVRLSTLNCQARLIHRRYFLPTSEIPLCADEYESGLKRAVDDEGAALQGLLFFADQKRFFLNGISFLLRSVQSENEELPYLFTDTNLHLDWILDNMNIGTKRNSSLDVRFAPPSRIDRLPVGHESRRRLFNFNTCGLYSNNSNEPWVGYVRTWNTAVESYQMTKCTVTLISKWYAVGPARCLNHEPERSIVQFGGFEQLTAATCDGEFCKLPTQTIAIGNVILHPDYNTLNHDNNIALVQLAAPADVGQENVRPICLPVLDELRSYDVSSMRVASEAALFDHSLITPEVGDNYLDPAECQKRWDGQALNIPIQRTKLCILRNMDMSLSTQMSSLNLTEYLTFV